MPVNTAALKTFAPAMRRQLLEAVGRKLDLLLNSQTPDTLSTYAKQIAELRAQEADSREQLLERVAYTWFNRLCALRYLDAKGWHPFGCKVLMPAADGETQPELLKLMRAGSLPAELKPHTNEARLHGLLDGQIPPAIAGADPQGEVYRELVLASCRSYHQLLPELFEGLDDASELLLPDDLLSEGSIAGGFRSAISDADCEDVEIIGWLYQFYISEKKDEVMARKKAVPTEDIPAVTQLFTPHWIVRYLVENSLGRLWLLSRPSSKLREHMPYYIEGGTETDFLKINKPEEIKLLDPACGSGHMLTYAFDLLTLIYEEEGYALSEIPGLILRHNLHGLEICPRAAQLAELALVFKAREQSRRFFQSEQLVQPRIVKLQDIKIESGELNDYIESFDHGELIDHNLIRLIRQFESAGSQGSLIQPCLDEKTILSAREVLQSRSLDNKLLLRETHHKVLRIIDQSLALARRYLLTLANPPYMGSKSMEAGLSEFSKKRYPDSKSDLYAIFVERCLEFAAGKGYVAMITMQSWMFLSSYESFRARLSASCSIERMAHLGERAFDTIGGSVVSTTAFVLKKQKPGNAKGIFIRLVEGEDEANKNEMLLTQVSQPSANTFTGSWEEFSAIPGRPIAYWTPPRLLDSFIRFDSLGSVASARIGMATGNNSENVRFWYEVDPSKIGFNSKSRDDALKTGAQWFPYSKGGAVRRWEGNREHVVNWESDGNKLRTTLAPDGSRVWAHNFNLEQIFNPAICWTVVTTSKQSFRYFDHGYLFDAASGLIQCRESSPERLFEILAFLNSKVAAQVLSLVNPTINLHPGYLEKLPYPGGISVGDSRKPWNELIELAKRDWDDLETSWQFNSLPILDPSRNFKTDQGEQVYFYADRLSRSWERYEEYCKQVRRRAANLELLNNEIWISAFNLQGSLEPDFVLHDLDLLMPDKKDLAYKFLSFYVGCFMGRFQLLASDHKGGARVCENKNQDRLQPEDNPDSYPSKIEPILVTTDSEWFENDIVARLNHFIKRAFPDTAPDENLCFLEEALSKDIRKYFCTEFYKDHLQTYKKRPIYWMVQSPKKGFACLIYLHRYTKDTLNQVHNNYFRPYLQKLEARLAQLGLDQLNDDLPTRERTAARKEAEKNSMVLKECQAWEQDALLPLAQQRIALDLDDGVKVNYLKLQEVLAPIPGLAAKDD